MLVLSRRKGESIIIDGKIEVKIVELDDGRVRIGIDAPRDIEIHRKEVFDIIMKENQTAAQINLNLEHLKGIKVKRSLEYKKNAYLKDRK